MSSCPGSIAVLNGQLKDETRRSWKKNKFMNGNILDNDKIPVNGEIFKILLKQKNIVIEKIISSNLIPEKQYIQDHDEWVLLVDGKAEIFIHDKKIWLTTGDYLFIESGVPHKVLQTHKGTVWLAIHIY